MQRRLMAQTMAKYKPVYTYRFDQPPQNGTIEYGTGHFQEVAYVFSNPLPTQNPLGRRAGDAELAKAMTSAWVTFVHDQNPNYEGTFLSPSPAISPD
jgi:acetylcholinesterase